MQQIDRGATPSELQATILNRLVKPKQALEGQVADYGTSAKLIAPHLLNALGGGLKDASVSMVSQSVSSALSWCDIALKKGTVCCLAAREKDANAGFVLLPFGLLPTLLAITLGGRAPTENGDDMATPTALETRFALKLAPALGTCLSSIAKTSLKRFSILQADATLRMEEFADAPNVVFEFHLQLGGAVYGIAVAIARSALKPSDASETRKEPILAHAPNVAGEIGRTCVRVEVLCKLPDQTLDCLQSLKPGDVISLAHSSFKDARILVRGHEIFAGQIGRKGENYAFKVSNPSRQKTGGLSSMVRALTELGEAT